MTMLRTKPAFRAKIGASLGIALILGALAAGPADARRGGSFGSRGARTYSQPRQTETSPGYVAPVQRSMTPAAPGGAGPNTYAPRPGQPGYAGAQPIGQRFGGFGGGFMGGLITGGLIGGLMGHGFGGGWGGGFGGGGFLTILVQLALVVFAVSLIARLFRRRQTADTAPGFGGLGGPWDAQSSPSTAQPQGFGGFGGAPRPQPAQPLAGPAREIPIDQSDEDTFDRLLKEIQDAFGREDYAGLRERTTPEVMSYLAEELSENATHGRRNEVTGTKLIQADVGEAWREGDIDYATTAMRYESIDLMRDRTTGAVLSGDPDRATQTVELWTFARVAGGPWKLSAIQSN
jgi:predicted lipid-binding transport protein (Tim44 family)